MSSDQDASATPLQKNDALLLIDLQRDYFDDGPMAVDGAKETIAPINRWLEDAGQKRATIFASRDWHPQDHRSFQDQGGPHPAHCVQKSEGAQLHPDLELPTGTIIINKGEEPDAPDTSAFKGTDLEERFKDAALDTLFVAGLPLDATVRQTVLDALEADIDVCVIRDGCCARDPERTDGVLTELEAAGAQVTETPTETAPA